MNKRFAINKVIPAEPLLLTVTFGDGATMDIDMSTIISQYPSLLPLKTPSLFLKARIDESGRNVVWNDDIDLAGDNLRAEAVEQNGGISHERIWNWMHQNKLTLDTAAEALGISRRMLAYYRNAEKPIPKHIWLACLGWEHFRNTEESPLKKAA
jgi:hypothetical protein